MAEVFRMFVRRWSAVVLCVMAGVSCRVAAQQQSSCATHVPANIDAGIFERDMLTLANRSETFRAQCDRLAQGSHVRVKIDMVVDLDSGRAQTAIHRRSSGAIDAEITVLFGENY